MNLNMLLKHIKMKKSDVIIINCEFKNLNLKKEIHFFTLQIKFEQ